MNSYSSTESLTQGGRAPTKRPATIVIGTILGHVLAAASLVGVVMLIKTHYLSATWREKGFFQSFGMHPIMMAAAFIFLSPIGALSYKTYEHLLGLSHSCTKALHAFIQTLALVFGLVGFAVIWTVHTGGVHFQTAHSWIGVAALCLFTLQWVVGVMVYLLPCLAGPSTRGMMMPFHVFVGSTATAFTIISCITGCLALVWKPTQAGGNVDIEVWRQANVIACVMAALLVAIMFVFYEAARQGLGKLQVIKSVD